MEDRMKHILFALALILGFAFLTSVASANPAMMKKHPGYPDETGKATTDTGATALTKGAEDAPKDLKNQLREANGGVADQSQLKRRDDSRLPDVVGPGHVTTKGVTENYIKDATKVNAAPK
jgi:hypothetical protein